MTSIKKVIFYGFLVWLIPFAAGFLFFPIHESNRILFESIMPVVVTGAVVFLGYHYLKTSNHPKTESMKLGVIWFLMSIAIDLVLFLSPSPMQMGIVEYVQDIGLTYLIIPIVIIGMGYSISDSK
jgi:hypothetical protein